MGFRPLTGMCLSNLKEISMIRQEVRSFPSPNGDVFVKLLFSYFFSIVRIESFRPLTGMCLSNCKVTSWTRADIE